MSSMESMVPLAEVVTLPIIWYIGKNGCADRGWHVLGCAAVATTQVKESMIVFMCSVKEQRLLILGVGKSARLYTAREKGVVALSTVADLRQADRTTATSLASLRTPRCAAHRTAGGEAGRERQIRPTSNRGLVQDGAALVCL
jgi:hypothetical protein